MLLASACRAFYTTVIFAGFIDWVLWWETPDLLSFIGAALVCFAGILAIRHANPVPGDPATATPPKQYLSL